MTKLVEALKLEHVNIVKMLFRVNELGIETEAGQKALLAAKGGLLAHLQREDDELYPRLREVAKDDLVVQDVLDFFLEDIARVSAFALEFFDKYTDVTEENDFAADFAILAEQLTQRIRKEETVIYRQLDQFDG
jgi:hypothetical protein